MNCALARAAQGFIGVPFRLHGRDPASGLDCVGLVAASLAAIGRAPVPPQGYALRMLALGPLLPFAEASGLQPVDDGGDVLLVRAGPLQPHLLVMAPGGAVHAHAALGRVVFLPGDPEWPVIRQWRLAEAAAPPPASSRKEP